MLPEALFSSSGGTIQRFKDYKRETRIQTTIEGLREKKGITDVLSIWSFQQQLLADPIYNLCSKF